MSTDPRRRTPGYAAWVRQVLKHCEPTCIRCGYPVDMTLPPSNQWGPTADHEPPLVITGEATPGLDGAGIAWREALVGGGVTTIGAAAAAGLAVAAMVSRAAPADAEDVTERLGLPALPARDLVLHANLTGANATTLRRIAGAVRAA